ncbi:hypothetical protein [uncultured Tenacibaculum sp.]|uniref:hypothetical protein n=1 Tax=uncultured Tenacibaculum sp. TaxID=174713 RepID=UPI00262C88E4|nr:hypothetical protein [uncultured Tenacibaculum sp.]
MEKVLIILKMIASFYIILIGFNFIKHSKDKEKNDNWRENYALFFKIGGIVLLLYSIYQILNRY